jgi:glycosyltransferase involved in cell wall biosynthesis
MIVKNEQATLPDCLASLAGVVDEIVVYDTGSTDDTVTLARAAGARVVQGYWDNDFARARNAALDLTRAEWILVIDADERLEASPGALRAFLGGSGTRGALPYADLVQLNVINVDQAGEEIDTAVVFRLARRSAVRWHGRVHELLRTTHGPAHQVRLTPDVAGLRHLGYADDAQVAAKARRNLALARAQVDALSGGADQEAGATARAWLDLARSLLGAGAHRDAAQALATVRKVDPQGPYRAKATELLAQLRLTVGEPDECVETLIGELEEDPFTPSSLCCWLRAQMLIRRGEHAGAADLLRGIDVVVDSVGTLRPLASPRENPLLAATLIVKDEAATLPGCLASLTGIVDEIVVYDTGSTDDTVTLARAAGARVVQGYWDNDFARARNAALDLTRAEWILVIDADERLTGDGATLRAYLRSDPADLLVMRVANLGPDGQVLQTLLSHRIARRAAVRWNGRVHEQLQATGPGAERARSAMLGPDVHLVHHGYADAGRRRLKAERNLALAQAQLDALLAERSIDPVAAARALLDLGRTAMGLGRRQVAVDAFEALREIRHEGGHRAQATALLTQILLDEGGLDEIALVLAGELRADGLTPVSFCDWLEAQALDHLGDRARALELLAGITELTDPSGNEYSLGPLLLIRALLAAAHGLVEAAGADLVAALTEHQADERHYPLLLDLFTGREPELAHALEPGRTRYGATVLAGVRLLGEAGRRVGALADAAAPRTAGTRSGAADPAGTARTRVSANT